MEILNSTILVVLYLYALTKAVPLYRLHIGSAGWRRAWGGVILLAVVVILRRGAVVVDILWPFWALDALLMHEIFRYGLPLIAAIVTVGVAHEHAAIFLRPTPSLYPNVPIITMDQFGKCVSWNEACTEMFGWESGEVLGKELAEVLVPERFREQHQAGLELARMGGPTPVLDRPFQTMALHQDGSEIPVEVIVTQSVHGRSITYIGMIRSQGASTTAPALS